MNLSVRHFMKLFTVILLITLIVSSYFFFTPDPLEQSSSKPAPDITVKMNNAELFKSGNDWLYTFKKDTTTCYIVGKNVKFKDINGQFLIAQLDQNVSINVPLNGQHTVLVTDLNGFHQSTVKPSSFKNTKQFLKSVVNATIVN